MQDSQTEIEERLREAASIGDVDLLRNLCRTVNVNSQNNINGWTALHWGAKRNHVAIVKILMEHGADKNIRNNKEETAAQLTNNQEILEILGGRPSSTEDRQQTDLPITANYLANPPFPHFAKKSDPEKSINASKEVSSKPISSGMASSSVTQQNTNEIVLKARVAYMEETDFIEVELDRCRLTFAALVQLLCAELNVDSKLIQKVRKCPDTIIRKDKDVARLRDFQEVELVLSNKAQSSLSRTYGNFNGIGSNLKQEQILY